MVRQKLRNAHKTRVEPGLVRQIEARKRKRYDILVSYFFGVGKSGASVARTYATECEIKLENVVERNRLARVLQNRSGINALVIADDFVGTGSQISDELKRLERDIGGIIREKNIRVVLIVTAALLEGQKQLEQVLDQLGMPIELYVGQILSEEDTCFSPKSRMFSTDEERELEKIEEDEYIELDKD